MHQRLSVGIQGDELNTPNSFIYHAVNGVTSSAANAYNSYQSRAFDFRHGL
jgi:hypothetical protein